LVQVWVRKSDNGLSVLVQKDSKDSLYHAVIISGRIDPLGGYG
jgi:hypothetical protein